MPFLFDVSRHLRRLIRTTPTGIDRVDAAYIRLLPELAGDVSFVAKRPGFNGLRRVDQLLPAEENGARRGSGDRRDGVYAELSTTWQAGLAAFTDNLSGRIEYQYVDFGSHKIHGAGLTTDASPNFHAVRLGVNYKF